MILLVDDEEMIRDMGQAMLEHLGYSVATAADGNDAIEIYRNRHHEIELVILDMIMPKLGGAEVFKSLREINPDASVLISSGYSRESSEGLLQEGAAGFIKKPFTKDQLKDAVSEAKNYSQS